MHTASSSCIRSRRENCRATLLAPTRERASCTSPDAPTPWPLGVLLNHADSAFGGPISGAPNTLRGHRSALGPHYASTPSTARRRHTFGSLPKVWVGGASHSLGSHSFTPPCSAGHPSLETLLPPSHLLPPLVHEPDAHSAQPPSRGFQAAPPPSALRSRPPAGGTPFGSLPKVWVGGVASSSFPFTCSQVIFRTSYIGLPPCCRDILMASRLGGNRFGIRLGGFFVVVASDVSHTAPRRTSAIHLPQQPLRQPPLGRPQAPLPPHLRPLHFHHQQPQSAPVHAKTCRSQLSAARPSAKPTALASPAPSFPSSHPQSTSPGHWHFIAPASGTRCNRARVGSARFGGTCVGSTRFGGTRFGSSKARRFSSSATATHGAAGSGSTRSMAPRARAACAPSYAPFGRLASCAPFGGT